jgi:hypothetical protein
MRGKGGPSVYGWTQETAIWRKIPRKDALKLDAAGVSDVIDESFEDRHKEKIYRTLERDIKGRAPHLQFLFNAIVD